MTAAQRTEEEEVGSVCIATWRSERYQEPAVCGLGWTECLAEAEKTNARWWWFDGGVLLAFEVVSRRSMSN